MVHWVLGHLNRQIVIRCGINTVCGPYKFVHFLNWTAGNREYYTGHYMLNYRAVSNKWPINTSPISVAGKTSAITQA